MQPTAQTQPAAPASPAAPACAASKKPRDSAYPSPSDTADAQLAPADGYAPGFAPTDAPRRLRRAETVLRNRSGRLILILDGLMGSLHQQAMIRTAESLGIQYVFAVAPRVERANKRVSHKVVKGSRNWVTVRHFDTVLECVAAAKELGAEVWALGAGPQCVYLPPGPSIDSAIAKFNTSKSKSVPRDGQDAGAAVDTVSDSSVSASAAAGSAGGASAGEELPGRWLVPLPLDPLFFGSHNHRPPTLTPSQSHSSSTSAGESANSDGGECGVGACTEIGGVGSISSIVPHSVALATALASYNSKCDGSTAAPAPAKAPVTTTVDAPASVSADSECPRARLVAAVAEWVRARAAAAAAPQPFVSAVSAPAAVSSSNSASASASASANTQSQPESQSSASFFALDWAAATAGLDSSIALEGASMSNSVNTVPVGPAPATGNSANNCVPANASSDSSSSSLLAVAAPCENVFDFAPVAAALTAAINSTNTNSNSNSNSESNGIGDSNAALDPTHDATDTFSAAASAATVDSAVSIAALAASDPSFSSLMGFPPLVALVVADLPTPPLPYLAAASRLVYVPAHGAVAAAATRALAGNAAAHAITVTDNATAAPGSVASVAGRVQQPWLGLYSPLGASARLAATLERVLMLCPEARGSLSRAQRDMVRAGWLRQLGKKPAQMAEFAKWLDREIAPLEELRIEEKIAAICTYVFK